MYLWESDIQESVVFKPVEIRGKRGRKKLKKSNAAIYIPNMDADNFEKICNENGLKFVYVEVPPHGDLIDRNALGEHKFVCVPHVTVGGRYVGREYRLGWNSAIEAIMENAETVIGGE